MGANTRQIVESGGWSQGEPMPPVAGRDAAATGFAGLARAVERDVIPRLVIAHRPTPVAARAAWVPGATEIEALTGFVLANDLPAQEMLLERAHTRGLSADSLAHNLLAPAARRLGEMWQYDLCDFTAVTIGVWRLQVILREHAGGFLPPPALLAQGRRVMLLPVPGEQHTFGLAVVAESFHRAGWHVSSTMFDDAAELAGAVRRERFDIVGISAGCGEHIESLAAAVRAIRRGSRNRWLGIMVGGATLVGHPDLAALVGADASASDGREAVAHAQILLDRQRVAAAEIRNT